MKRILLAVIIGIFSMTTLVAQNFNGVATYKSKRKMDIPIDTTQIDPAMEATIRAMVAKQFEKEYELRFNKDESLFKEVEKLDAPSPHNMQMVMIGGGEDDTLFKNVKSKQLVHQTSIMGKMFLIKDQIEQPEWELTQEKKNIGEYTCYKAVMQHEVTIPAMSKKEQPKKKKIKIQAWYTPELAVSHGPRHYWGLPGLILEVNDGEETLICSKIQLNPKKKNEIKAPKQGKVVSQEEFTKISLKKMKEMQDRYGGGEGDGGVHIQIGG